MTAGKCCVLILIATIAALALRLPQLPQRPMHGDEAVNAYKFGKLLEENRYEYDPDEYHGPSLYYATFIPAWLSQAGNFVALNERMLRVVPVVFGVLLILGLLGLGDGLGWLPAVFAAVFTALSPAMVFYSRYYIHEMLLVCFTLGVVVSGYRYLRRPGWFWAVLAGVCAGLMHATKETCVIAFGCLGLGMAGVLWMGRREGKRVGDRLKVVRPAHLALALGVALVTSALFFSSFFSHPRGVVDSLLTYRTYLDRAGGTQVHDQPWHFYLGLLGFYRYADGPVYTEGAILLLAVAGLWAAGRGGDVPGVNRDVLRFLAVYTVAMTVIYSALSYKTPWCLLGFFHGMILLAGVGAAWLVRARSRWLAGGGGVLLAAAVGHLAFQAWTGSFKYYADSRNPYVYGHTGLDIFRIAGRVKELAAAHEKGREMRVQVFCPGNDFWPLPWYLRGYHVEYGDSVPLDVTPAPVILIQPPLEADLMRVLYELRKPGEKELYMYMFYQDGKVLDMELRPGVEILGFVAKSLWDRVPSGDTAAVRGQGGGRRDAGSGRLILAGSDGP